MGPFSGGGTDDVATAGCCMATADCQTVRGWVCRMLLSTVLPALQVLVQLSRAGAEKNDRLVDAMAPDARRSIVPPVSVAA